jgi:AcrR family transcriptional regulator
MLLVASELFYREGIRAVGVDRIAADADVSKATLYAHFGSKEGLVASYLARQMDRTRIRLDRRLQANDGAARSKILDLFDALADWHQEQRFRGCAFLNASSELTDPDHPGREIGRLHREWLHGVFAALAADAGAADPAIAATQLVMLFDAATVSAHVDGLREAALIARDAADRVIASW